MPLLLNIHKESEMSVVSIFPLHPFIHISYSNYLEQHKTYLHFPAMMEEKNGFDPVHPVFECRGSIVAESHNESGSLGYKIIYTGRLVHLWAF